jgi:hypothetical protein
MSLFLVYFLLENVLAVASLFVVLVGENVGFLHRIPGKKRLKMRPNPRRWGRSACTASAYLINPIAVENCGF